MFELDRFKADCTAVAHEREAVEAIREILVKAMEDPGGVQKSVSESGRAGVQALHRSPDLTILNVVWGPGMTVMPHNHSMWAVIGIYSGREDNIFWRRLPGEASRRIEAAGAKALCDRDVFPLGRDIIHSVTNPIGRLTGAIHVYGGDFFGAPRSEWDLEHLTEQRYDVQKALQLFEESNRFRSARG